MNVITEPIHESVLDIDLIQKYSIAGPRYTSYPPATQFKSDLENSQLEAVMREDNGPDAGPISLYFHLPFCESLCWYCGCNTVITTQRDEAAKYLDDIEKEVALVASKINPKRKVTQIHFGGGTPTFLPPEQLRRLGAMIRKYFTLSSDVEFGVEIDPRRLTKEHVLALKDIGANRASLGIQDTNAKVQIAIHRVQPMDNNRQAFTWLREAGFNSINVDLIFGLPLQTQQTFEQTIKDVLTLNPERLSIFSYAHVPWIKPAQLIFVTRNQLPSPADKLSMFATAHEKLTEAGYVDIGLDHFARPDDELAIAQKEGTLHRNFQGYSTAAGASLYGFGVSSISSTENSYRQNYKDLDQWRNAVRAGILPTEKALILTEEDKRRRTLIMRLMCDRKLNFAALSEELGVDVAKRYAKEIEGLRDLEDDGLLVRDLEGITLTRRGVPLMRVVAMRFDATWVEGASKHSKTV
jgi:oxygen-independent coproporphyrinogen-3 oxidase